MNKSYNEIHSIENLRVAWQRAKKGKTKRRYIKRFQRNLEENLYKLEKKTNK